MNFFAHATLAARRSDQPSWIVGSMAPDFASMAGMRLRAVEGDEALAEGVNFHHRSDDAFHGAPIFLELMDAAREELEARGLGFGPAAAIGHVGVELLLDGHLVERLGGVPDSYAAAVASAAALDEHLLFHKLDPADGRRRWRNLCTRLQTAPLPDGYQAPEFVAERLIRILARRPRLAVPDDSHALVFEWAERARGTVAGRASALIDQVEARLAAAAGASDRTEE